VRLSEELQVQHVVDARKVELPVRQWQGEPPTHPAVLAHSPSGPRRNVPRGVGRHLLPEPDCARRRRLWQAEVPVGDPRNVFPEIVDKLDPSKLGKCSCMCSNMLK
jgi:hypothetical protein